MTAHDQVEYLLLAAWERDGGRWPQHQGVTILRVLPTVQTIPQLTGDDECGSLTRQQLEQALPTRLRAALGQHEGADEVAVAD